MPEGAEDVAVLRVVVRDGFSRDLADELLKALSDAVASLEKSTADAKPQGSAFTH
jgi:glutamate decarboxylase